MKRRLKLWVVMSIVLLLAAMPLIFTASKGGGGGGAKEPSDLVIPVIYLDVSINFAQPIKAGVEQAAEDDLLKTLFLTVYLSQLRVDTRLSRLIPFPLAPIYKEWDSDLVEVEEAHGISRGDPFRARPYRSDIRDLIREFPNVFPEFRWFPVDRLTEKSMLVDSIFSHSYRADSPVG